jgi:hypothetical protein
MGTPDEKQVEEIRARALHVLEQAKADPAYLQRLKEDPETALTEAGFSSSETGQLIGELGLGEVAGYVAGAGVDYINPNCEFTCNTGTCVVTWCNFIPVTNA